MQAEVVHRPNARNTLPRPPRAPSVHERAAHRAEVVGHGVAGGDGLVLAVLRELVLAAEVLHGVVGDDEVRREHGGSDLAAVGAVADEGVDEAGGFDGLGAGLSV